LFSDFFSSSSVGEIGEGKEEGQHDSEKSPHHFFKRGQGKKEEKEGGVLK